MTIEISRFLRDFSYDKAMLSSKNPLSPLNQKLLILTGMYIFCILLAEIFGIKTISLGIGNIEIGPIFIKELKVSVAIFLLPLIFSINDIIIEVWGKPVAKTIYRLGLGCIMGLVLFVWLATRLPSSELFIENESAYDLIFGQTLRIAIASVIAFGISDLLDIIVFSRLRKNINNLALSCQSMHLHKLGKNDEKNIHDFYGYTDDRSGVLYQHVLQ